MKCLNKSLPVIQEALKEIESEPLVAMIVEGLPDGFTINDIRNRYNELIKAFQPLLNTAKEQGTFVPATIKAAGINVKPGVETLFENTPELASVGTQQEFSEFLDEKFPASKVKDILYHGTYEKFQKFSEEKKGATTGLGYFIDPETQERFDYDSANAFFFSNVRNQASSYAFLGRQSFLENVESSLRGLYFKIGGKDYNASVEFLQTVPYFNELLTDNEGNLKSRQEIEEIGKEELSKFLKTKKLGDARAFTNRLLNIESYINQLNNLLDNIDRLKANDKAIPNRFGTFERYSLSTGEYYIYYDKQDSQYHFVKVGGRRFKSNEASTEEIRNFLLEAIDSSKKRDEERIQDMKKLGYIDQVMPVILDIRKPLAHDYQGSAFPDVYERSREKEKQYPTAYIAARQVKKALQEGYDSVVYENITDPVLSTSYGVFKTDQIYTLGTEENIKDFKDFVEKRRRASMAPLSIYPEDYVPRTQLEKAIVELKGFTVFDDSEAVCASGICNHTARKSEEALREAGLNPFPTGPFGDNLAVTVKSPLGDFNITHYVAAVALDNSVYIYDMPQGEFIDNNFYGMPEDVKLKTVFKPRFIALTMEDVMSNYNLSITEAGNFIKQIINKKETDVAPAFKDYIKKNVPDAEEYIKELDTVVSTFSDAQLPFDEMLQKERADIRQATLYKKLSKEEQLKVQNLLETKLKLKTRAYAPKTADKFILRDLIRDIFGDVDFKYDAAEGFENVMKRFKDYLQSDKLVDNLIMSYKSAESQYNMYNKQLEKAFDTRRLILNFLKSASSFGWNTALSKYDSYQNYTIRTSLPTNIIEKYPNEKQRIGYATSQVIDVNSLLKDTFTPGIKEGQSKLDFLTISRTIQARKMEKAKVVLNYLNLSIADNALSEGVDYLFDLFNNEAQRRYKFFADKGDPYFSLDMPGETTPPVTPEMISKVETFLRRAGMDVQELKKLVVNGNIVDANALVDFTRRIVQYTEGKKDALTEEAAHVAFEMVVQTNPKLAQQMIKEIGKDPIYQKVFSTYSSNPYYIGADGKPDILKLKKEAIGKKMAEILAGDKEINNLRTNLTFVDLISRLFDWLKGLFVRTDMNPFKEALKATILNDQVQALETATKDIFLQTEEGEPRVVDIQEDIFNRIVQGAPTQGTDRKYMIGNIVLPERASDYEMAEYKRIFGDGDMDESEYNKAIKEEYSKSGTAGHDDIKYIGYTLVDPATGFRRAQPLDDSTYSPKTNTRIYVALKKFITDKLDTVEQRLTEKGEIPGRVRFLFEQAITDKKIMGGTADFIAISPIGKVVVNDWKFKSLNDKKFKDVPWYDKRAWNAQMTQYVKMLNEGSGIPIDDFVETAMVPIRAKYSTVKREDGKTYPKLDSIEVANKNIKFEENDYLLPVPLKAQTTGDEVVDEILRKFNGLYTFLELQRPKTAEGKLEKIDQMQLLEKAIRHLQVKNVVGPLVIQAESYIATTEDVFKEYYDNIAKQDFNAMKVEDLSAFALKVNKVYSIIDIYTNLDVQLESLFSAPDITAAQQKSFERLREVVAKAKSIKMKLNKLNNEFAEKTANIRGIKDIVMPEAEVGFFGRTFTDTSRIQIKTLQASYQFRRDAQNLMDFKTNEENTKLLEEIMPAYNTWAAQNNLTAANKYDILQQKGKNLLVDEIKSEFYNAAEEAVKSKDIKWIMKNINVGEYRKALDEKMRERLEYLKIKTYAGTPEEQKKQRQADIEAVMNDYDTEEAGDGWFTNYYTLIKFPKKDIWTSDEWKTLNKSENAPALALYNWVRTLNEKAMENGYLPADRNASKLFLPFLEGSLTEKITFGSGPGMWETWLNMVTIDEDTEGYGQRDPISGELILRIPTPFKTDTGKTISKDFAKNIALYNAAVNYYNELHRIEGIVLSMQRVEENKKVIQTSQFGTPKFDKSRNAFDLLDRNVKNADLTSRQYATLLYGQKYIRSEQLDMLFGKVNTVTTAINKAIGYNVLPTNFGNRQFSLIRGLDTLNNLFRGQKIGLNPLAATSNLFGGTAQAMVKAGRYFTKTDLIRNEYSFTTNTLASGTWQSEEGKKKLAAVQYFMPYTDDMNREIAQKLAESKFSAYGVQEALFAMMRGTERVVQSMVFLSFLDNALLINGKIINAREYVRQQPEYQNRYKTGNIKEIEAKLEDQVKAAIEKHGLMKQAKLENNKFVIPGMERMSNEVFNVRNMSKEFSKTVLGSMTPEEIRGNRQNIFWRSATLFKDWIPTQADERFGALKFNSATKAMEWGRYRTLFRYIYVNYKRSLLGFRSAMLAIKGDREGMEALRDLYEYKRATYYKTTGRKWEMTEEEFYDLVRENLRIMMKEVIGLGVSFALMIGVILAAPDDDEDKMTKNVYKLTYRALDKYTDELSFFMNPVAFQKILSGNYFPAIGVVTDLIKISDQFMKESWGFFYDDEMQEKAHPLKYIMKFLPGIAQMSSFMPFYLPSLAEEFDIRVAKESRIR